MEIFHRTIHSLEQSLDYSMAKQRTITHNIANADTPGYKAKDVVFHRMFENALKTSIRAKKTHPKHLSFSEESHLPYRTVTKHHTIYNHNRNNVDIDREMTELAKNQIYYQTSVD